VYSKLSQALSKPACEILHCACQLRRLLPIAVIFNKETCGGNPLQCAEKTDLVEKLNIVGLEGGEEVEVDVGVDKGVADLDDGDEMVQFHTGDIGGFLNGGRREAFADEGGDEGSILIIEAEAVGEDVDLAGYVEVVVLRREGF